MCGKPQVGNYSIVRLILEISDHRRVLAFKSGTTRICHRGEKVMHAKVPADLSYITGDLPQSQRFIPAPSLAVADRRFSSPIIPTLKIHQIFN